MYVMAWLPTMIELELMGINPVEFYFKEKTPEDTEKAYIALSRAKKKHPQWYEAVGSGLYECGIMA